ncbi:hypothetical protein BH23ACT11_BH23ACT11_18840 [soil metagenome]
MEHTVSRERFIRLGAAIGVTTVGATVVAACGGSASGGSDGDTAASDGGGSTSAGASGTSTDSAGSSGAIAQTSEVAENTPVKFTNDGQPAVLIHLEGGDYVAYSAICTHQQCTVAYQPESSQLVCPCHGSIFDPSSGGEVVSGPAQQPLPEIPVQVEGGKVTKA